MWVGRPAWSLFCSAVLTVLSSFAIILLRKRAGPEVIKLFSSTQPSMEFQLLIKTKYQQIKKCFALNLSDVVIIMLINVKMLTIVGILTCMSRINFVLS